MILALSRFTVKNGMAEDVKRAFRERPHRVEAHAGFVRLEVVSPRDAPEEIWLMTWWTDEASFRAWHGRHLHESHTSIPKGLKLVPQSTELRVLDLVAT